MMVRSPLIRLLLAAILACGSLAPAAWAETTAFTGAVLTKARETCLAGVLATLPATPSANQSVQALRDEAGELRGPCAPLPDVKPDLVVALTAIGESLTDAKTAYGCRAGSTRPACRALQAAEARYGELRLFKLGKTEAIRLLPEDHYSRANAYWWVKERGSFGVKPGVGTSLMRLVLDASAPDTPLARRVQVETTYEDIKAEVLAANTPCLGCKEEVAQVISLWPVFDGLQRGFTAATNGNFDPAIDNLEVIVGQWNAYHFGGGQGRAQLPWELVVNSVIYAQNRTPTAGWHKPPGNGVTLLHPSPGLALKDVHGADTIINVVEVLGWSRWDYDGDTHARTNEWGVSAVAAYRDRDDAKDWGYGALIRTPVDISGAPLNLVWTRTKLNAGGHDDTFAISVDLSRFFPQMKSAARLFDLPSADEP